MNLQTRKQIKEQTTNFRFRQLIPFNPTHALEEIIVWYGEGDRWHPGPISYELMAISTA